jgi:FkbM family methyltransferase
MNNFEKELVKNLKKNYKNNHRNNYDYYRFNIINKPSNQNALKSFIKKIILTIFPLTNKKIKKITSSINKHITDFSEVYNQLENHQSKKLLINIIAYNLLGQSKVKLPLNSPFFWSSLKEMKSHASTDDLIKTNFQNWILYKTNINKFGFPITLYNSIIGSHVNFILKQYLYKNSKISIGVKQGDTVIDAGGCWGDSTLYFAHEAGKKGRVYVFEFIPSNLKIMEKNFNLNPKIKPSIEIINQPIWDVSNKSLYYTDNGPGSRVSFEKTGQNVQIKTLTIDDMVKQKKPNRIDFIKMDIEGAEQNALKGAINTIKAFKPKLAIAVYHSYDDLIKIPKYLNNLNLGYKFYIAHYTIHSEETILFATT